MKYEVKIKEVYQTTVIVDADAPWDAKDKAKELIMAGVYPDGTPLPEATYDHTMDPVDWGFWEA